MALLQLPAHAEYARLLGKVRAELERRGQDARTVSLKSFTPQEHLALANLTGAKRLHTAPRSLRVSVLDAALKQSALACGLFELLEALHGTLRDQPAERALRHQSESEIWSEASRQLADHPAATSLVPWLNAVRQRGLLKRLGLPVGALLTQVLPVVQAFPANALPLSVLAAQTLGDAHALDRGRPLAHMALSAAAALTGAVAVPAAAGQRRRLWAEVGVICDLLSCDVLVYNLRPTSSGRLAQHLQACAEAGEPTRITLRELMRHGLTWAEPRVFICENPCVPALAADHLGPHSHGLICTEGFPTTAVLHLLGSLHQSGTRLHFHGDFDWGGLRIGNHLLKTLRAHPWRFDAPSYLRHVAEHAPRSPLKGRPVVASWDPQLQEAMTAHGGAVFEEQVATELLGDLA